MMEGFKKLREKDKIVVWPAYFDRTKTRGEGRRIPKSLAVNSPKISDITEAAEELDLKYELIPDAHYPKTPRQETGMLMVEKEEPKQKMIKKIGKQLSMKRKGEAKK